MEDERMGHFGGTGRHGLTGQQPITAPGLGDDDVVHFVMQCTAQLADALDQAVLGDHDMRPHRMHQFVLGHQGSGPSRQAP